MIKKGENNNKAYQLILILLSISILAAVIYLSDPAVIYGEIKKADMGYLAIVFIVPLLTSILRIFRWKVLLDFFKKISFSRLAPVFMAALTISNFTPARIGEASKSLFLKKTEGIPVSSSLGTVVWERLFDLITLMAFGVPFSLLLIGRLAQDLIIFWVLSLIFVTILVVGVIVGIYNEKIGYRLLEIGMKIPVLKKYVTEDFLKNFYKNAKMERTGLVVAFVISIIIWSIHGVAFYFSFAAVGITSFPLLFYIGIVGFTVLCGFVSFLPNGIGSTEAIFLAIMLVYGIPQGQAAAGILLGRGILLGIQHLIGLVSLLYLSKMYQIKG
ncbi:lysylphosphatidylglycerol synthase transmembrane domain-containing protein [Candidatus Undinarchaeota archaeon]